MKRTSLLLAIFLAILTADPAGAWFWEKKEVNSPEVPRQAEPVHDQKAEENGLMAWFKKTGREIKKSFKGAGKEIKKSSKEVPGELKKDAKETGHELKQGAKELPGKAKEGFKDIGQGFKQLGRDIKKGTKKALDD